MPSPADPRFAALEGEALNLLWQRDPVHASILGVERYDGLLPRTDPDSRAEFCWRAGELLGQLERLSPPDAADPIPAAERWALRSLLAVPRALEEEFSPYTRNPTLYVESLLQGVYILLQRPGPMDAGRVHSLISRLNEAPRLLEEGCRNLLPHAARVPLAWAEGCLRQTEGGQALISQALRPVLREVPRMGAQAEQAGARALEHLGRYAEFLRREILPRARGSFAAGRDLFHFLLREEHHLSYRDVDLEEWARHEIHETRKELSRLASGLAGGRDWREVLEDLKHDHPAADALLAAYREAVERARAFVRERGLATLPAQDDLVVEETPEFERGVIPFAAYLPPAPFGRRRRGSLWVTPPGRLLAEAQRQELLRDHCRARLPITALHETYPGHHLQLTRMCQIQSAVRRQFGTAVYVEGWALYCEEMMLEQGFLSDPRSRLCQLRDHLWRACRVLLDVGLHAGTLTIDEAADVLVQEACLQPPNAAAEVLRYTHTPTQPLSYLIGKREIQGLRREVERARGRIFSLREFHDEFLGHGALPIRFMRDILLAPAAEPAVAAAEPAPARA